VTDLISADAKTVSLASRQRIEVRCFLSHVREFHQLHWILFPKTLGRWFCPPRSKFLDKDDEIKWPRLVLATAAEESANSRLVGYSEVGPKRAGGRAMRSPPNADYSLPTWPAHAANTGEVVVERAALGGSAFAGPLPANFSSVF
jgi:hypothetical protein